MPRLCAAVVLGCISVALLCKAALAQERQTNAFVELGPVTVHSSEADALMLGLGAFDPFDNETSIAATLEYRLGPKLWFIGPALGGMANGEGGMFGYVGLYSDISIGNFYFTPQLGLGAYRRGGSRDLGGVFQFRQSVDLSYRFSNGHRLGLRVAHVSNADLHEQNPGEEEVYLTYSIAIGPLL
jgi:lipid A 3-O-deacylase